MAIGNPLSFLMGKKKPKAPDPIAPAIPQVDQQLVHMQANRAADRARRAAGGSTLFRSPQTILGTSRTPNPTTTFGTRY
jgi:hypothetical protein